MARRPAPQPPMSLEYGRPMFDHNPGVPEMPARSGGNMNRQWDLEGLIDSPQFRSEHPNETTIIGGE